MTCTSCEEFSVELVDAMTLLNEAVTLLRTPTFSSAASGAMTISTSSPSGDLASRIEAFLEPNTNLIFHDVPPARSALKQWLFNLGKIFKSTDSRDIHLTEGGTVTQDTAKHDPIIDVADDMDAMDEIPESQEVVVIERDRFREALIEITQLNNITINSIINSRLTAEKRSELWREQSRKKSEIAQTALNFQARRKGS